MADMDLDIPTHLTCFWLGLSLLSCLPHEVSSSQLNSFRKSL